MPTDLLAACARTDLDLCFLWLIFILPLLIYVILVIMCNRLKIKMRNKYL